MTITAERIDGPLDTVAASPPSDAHRHLALPHDLPEIVGIAEAAELTGLSAHTLRYYERIGLVDVGRDAAGRRAYDRGALSRVVFVTKLRHSDMPIAAVTRYVALLNAGPHTEPERLALLQEHRATTRRRLEELQAALAVIDYKITTYGGSCGT